VGRGYRLSHFWLAKEVHIEVKKEVAAIVLIKTIKYYENTKYTLKKGKKKSAELSCVSSSSRKCKIFPAQLKCTANGISVQDVNVLPNQWSHF
jgi:hypothetical protein